MRLTEECEHVISMESIKHRCDVVAQKHRGVTATWRGCMNWRTCALCGAWLSLGPSRDDHPEEIRAAEIAATGCLGERCEVCGWELHREGSRQAPSPTHNLDQFHAGWLAREIVEHKP
jgi:hypothetical protein